jgi:L-rhamnose mutarotase
MSRRFCFALDLKNDLALIAEYKKYHERIWPEITQSLKDSGIEDLQIYLLGTRMVMIMEVNQSFSFEKKTKADEQDPRVQAWGGGSCGDSSKRCPKQSQARNGCGWKVFLSWKVARRIQVACESKTMKLNRFGEAGTKRPSVLLDDGSRLDVSGFRGGS